MKSVYLFQIKFLCLPKNQLISNNNNSFPIVALIVPNATVHIIIIHNYRQYFDCVAPKNQNSTTRIIFIKTLDAMSFVIHILLLLLASLSVEWMLTEIVQILSYAICGRIKISYKFSFVFIFQLLLLLLLFNSPLMHSGACGFNEIPQKPKRI